MQKVNSLKSNATLYFEKFDKKGELKFSREVAKDICEYAVEYSIWILGIDVGILFNNGKYQEENNEGWITKTGLFSIDNLNNFKQRKVYIDDLKSNNLEALKAIDNIPNELNAFIITGLRVSLHVNQSYI